MKPTRRHLLAGTACAAGCLAARSIAPQFRLPAAASVGLAGEQPGSGIQPPTAYSITPVVRDGKWNWNEQPLDQSGFLDPREFEVRVGVRWRSDGTARNLRSSTVVPIGFPEQKIVEVKIEKSDECDAKLVPLSKTAAQLQVMAPVIGRGQTITATAVVRMELFRHCPHYEQDQFPNEQEVPKEISAEALGNSPGIRCEMPGVRELAKSVISRHDHPWNKARKYFAWVWENIEGKPGAYTSVQTAIRKGVGDCEERAGVFVALCRAAGIPARLVLVPNHCWAEFCLLDHERIPHWIPVHTAAYNWFGWTGTHELVLQKGDRIFQNGRDKTMRLISDWYEFEGRRPVIEYFGELVPADGPGKRIKNSRGGWDLDGSHPEDRFMRI